MESVFLEHGLSGKERANHKYKAREWVNGKWQYIYDEATGVNDRKKAAELRERASGLDKTQDAHNRSVKYLSDLTESVDNARLKAIDKGDLKKAGELDKTATALNRKAWEQVEKRVDNANEAERLRNQARNLETKASTKEARIHKVKNVVSNLSPSNIKKELTGENDRKRADIYNMAADMHYDRAYKAVNDRKNSSKYNPTNYTLKQASNNANHIINEEHNAKESMRKARDLDRIAFKKEARVAKVQNAVNSIRSKVNDISNEATKIVEDRKKKADANLKKTKKANNAVARAKKVLKELNSKK